MRLGLLIILVICSIINSIAQTSSIPFAQKRPVIDGFLDEWELNIDLTDLKQFLPYRNSSKAAWQWDEEYLYLAFQIEDNCLTENEKGNDNPRLYFNDAVEIYIDTHYDSKTKMDLNDYQFIISLNGESVIFKGDKEQIKEGNKVPKDAGIANIVFKVKSLIRGTLNKPGDKDEGYNIEVAIPWAAIGIIPHQNQMFKIDLCVDDIDTVANFINWPDDYHPLSMHFSDLNGKTDFGYPNDWTNVRLIGGPSIFYVFKQSIKENALPIICISLMLLIGLIILLRSQYKKILFLRNMPSKKDLKPLFLEEKENNSYKLSLAKIQINQESVSKARSYIEQNITIDISIEQLASYLNISTRQLQRLFKEEINLTPKQFITILRLERASTLLINGDLSVSEIAYETGFSDPAYFTNVFKRYFGVPPSLYGKA